jgi:hypothetical protein
MAETADNRWAQLGALDKLKEASTLYDRAAALVARADLLPRWHRRRRSLMREAKTLRTNAMRLVREALGG